jgi:hypothetical protein
MACFCTHRFFWAGIGLVIVIVGAYFLAKHIKTNSPNDGIDKEINVARIELLAEDIDKEKAVFDLKHYAFDIPEPKIVSGSWLGLLLEFHRIDSVEPWNKTTLQIQLPASDKFKLKYIEDSIWIEDCYFPLTLQEDYADSVFSNYDGSKVFPYILLTRMTKVDENTFDKAVLFFDKFTINMETLAFSNFLITAKISFSAASLRCSA